MAVALAVALALHAGGEEPDVWSSADAATVRLPPKNESFGGPGPLPPLDHDGIEDHFAGKSSTVLYRNAGRWLELTGMD